MRYTISLMRYATNQFRHGARRADARYASGRRRQNGPGFHGAAAGVLADGDGEDDQGAFDD